MIMPFSAVSSAAIWTLLESLMAKFCSVKTFVSSADLLFQWPKQSIDRLKSYSPPRKASSSLTSAKERQV